MFLDFAIVPQVFEKAYLEDNPEQLFALTALLRDISQRGMITALNNKDWNKEVLERIKILPKNSFEKMTVILNVLKDRHRIVGHPKQENIQYTTEMDWLALAKDLDTKATFETIISTQYCESCQQPLQAHEHMSELEAGTQVIIQNRENMKIQLSPLLRYARKLTLIDPYFNVTQKRFKDSLELMAECLSQRRGERLKESQIIINARFVDEYGAKNYNDRTDTPEYDQKWKEIFNNIQQRYGHKCKLQLWDDNKRMHDRYILTDQCGVSVGLGLDMDYTDSRESSWGMLQYDLYVKKREAVVENSSPYSLKKTILI
ncbi:hypothetical protein [Sulfuricurvum sp.]|uniref:hypothetical protein n=1 Tax=Sulfuricurvum sp. TaxID=2025608 RepID=UPI00261BC966|nr:hypothetical protein [Sulfuricurvum sp.]MDD3594855.1 hypothetical protein [Sulfuricurvum sp.]